MVCGCAYVHCANTYDINAVWQDIGHDASKAADNVKQGAKDAAGSAQVRYHMLHGL